MRRRRAMRSPLEELLFESRSALVLQLKEQQYWRQMIWEEPLGDYSVHTLLKVFGKCFSSRLHKPTQQEIVDEIRNSNFLTIHLRKFIENLFLDLCESQFENKLSCVVTFLEVLQRFTISLSEIEIDLCNILHKHMNKFIANGSKIDRNIRQKIERVQKCYKQYGTNSGNSSKNFQDDYKLVTILPIAKELTNQKYDTSIRACNNYMSFTHYLSTQFFILRNDLLTPMKSAIRMYLGKSRVKKKDSFKLYQQVQVKTPVLAQDRTIVYELYFDIRPFKNFDWDNSLNLIYGSLLCLSSDNFKTVGYAVVHSRDKVSQGILNVRFINEQGETDDNQLKRQNTTYLMVESPGFYEMYCSVLRGLQTQVLTNQFYLINIESYIREPNYLKQKPTFNLTSCYKEAAENYHELMNVNVADISKWPETMLNSEQQQALHKALTSSVSVIQAPPGTGKWFMGQKIVETLLINLCHTSNEPILVVFPNDNLLDRFAHKLFPKQSAIRIGGSSRDKLVDCYSINNVAKTELTESTYWNSMRQTKNELRQIRETLYELELFRYYKISHVIHESALEDLPYPDGQLKNNISINFHCEDSFRNSAMFSWLGLFSEDDTSTYRSNITDLSKANDNHVKEHEEIFDYSTETSQQGCVNEVEVVDITEVGTETLGRKLNTSLNQVYIERDEKIQEEESIKHLKIESLNDPFYVYNLEDCHNVKEENITDLARRKRFAYIKKHFYSIQATCLKRQHVCIQELRKSDILETDAELLPDVMNMKMPDRWKLYRRFIKTKEKLLEENIKDLKEKYESTKRRYHELVIQMEHDILRKAKVICITSNAAAKFQPILQEIGCKFIVIQDAGQILESQITVLLTPKTESLILIGDYKQMRPKVTSTSLLKETNLDISLFERCINSKIPTTTLKIQYRMRSEISQLCKHMYPEMSGDLPVFQSDNAIGMKHNVFLVNHEHKEQLILEPNSYINIFEAKFVAALCKYLLQQGYKSRQITILSPYLSQVLQIQQLIPKTKSYKDLRLMAIDHYQGEHNGIVLMSLVRSNAGYLRDKNRITVALSRGNLGLYVLGDFAMLERSSQFGNSLLSIMKEKNLIGTMLPLVCQRHPQSQVMIASSEDFSVFAPNGGCLEACSTVLTCSHPCNKLCHGGNHAICDKPCARKCERGHPCTSLCSESCPPCEVIVTKKLRCGHFKEALCSSDPDSEQCLMPCSNKCVKGHPCTTLCSESCPPCKVIVTKKLRCGHFKEALCSSDPDLEECLMPCFRKCEGGHPCGMLCTQPCPKCFVNVVKIFPCGHEKILSCYVDPNTYQCKETIKFKLDRCGHDQELFCYQKPHYLAYNAACSVDCNYRLECGHKCHLKCHTTIGAYHEDPECVKPCRKNITCPLGHTRICTRKCIDECISCTTLIEKTLSCGHNIEVACCNSFKTQICPKICAKPLLCGHMCTQKCQEICLCTTLVDITLPCSHTASVPCEFKDAKIEEVAGKQSTYLLKIYLSGVWIFTKERTSNEIVCNQPCKKLMICGHKCQHSCNQPCTTRCPLKSFVKQNCGHVVEMHCNNVTIPFVCPLKTSRKQKCGHVIQIPCTEISEHPDIINKRCQEPCKKILQCTHQCTGTCGKCFQGRVHVPCEQKCGRVQICGHVCDVPCSESCPPCQKDCPNRCPHSECSHVCGKPCSPCAELCEWKCPHYKCTKLCGEECNREPCDEPCPKKLECGHSCIGLCGEVCPPLCRTCNEEKLTEFQILCLEDEPDARFVYLEDCDHCIEVTALDQWMNQIDNEIAMKCCPRCKTTVWRCQRYGNVIRRCFIDVQKVKQKIFGKIGNLKDTMTRLRTQLTSELSIRRHFPNEYNQINQQLNQKATLHYNACNVIENQILILHSLAKLFVSSDAAKHITYHEQHTKQLVKRLMADQHRISPKELKAIGQECCRIQLNVKLLTIDKFYTSSTKVYKDNQEKLTIIRTLLHSGRTIEETEEKEAKNLFKTIMTKIPGLDITEEERLEIINAIDVGKKGHWFKCPNGHPYAIGECGGAMEESKCPDCGATVGGANHALVTGNYHAGDMDGSRHANYSQVQNLANFDPRQFQ